MRFRLSHWVIIGFTTLATAGCSKDASSNVNVPRPAATAVAKGASTGRARATTITLSLRVDKPDEAIAPLRAAIAAADGYATETSWQSQDDDASASFDAHVPVAKVAAVRAEIVKLGEVARDFEKAEDVADQQIDLQARLNNQRNVEKRLLELLSSKTGNLVDILAIEKELGSVRENIERMESQERLLSTRITYTEIHIDIRKRDADVSATVAIRRASTHGLHAARTIAVGAASVAAAVSPTLLMLGVLPVSALLVLRRRRKVASTSC